MTADYRISGKHGQKSFLLTGSARLSDGRSQEPVDVEFDLAHGRCTVTPSSGNGSTDTFCLYFHSSDRVHLLDVDVRPQGQGYKFLAQEMGPFTIARSVDAQVDCDFEIAHSAIAQALGLDSGTAPLNEMTLVPTCSALYFGISGLGGDESAEVLYRCIPPRRFDIEVDVSGRRVRIHTFKAGSELAEYLRCVSDSSITDDRLERIRVALSLLFRRRAVLHVVRFGDKVRINLSAPDQVSRYGLLTRNPKRVQETMQKLIDAAYLRNWYLLMEAFSNPGTLEVRMLNAMGHLEVVTGRYHLSWQTLKDHLGVSRSSAEIINEFRNRLIHDGSGVKRAMERAKDNLDQKPSGTMSTKVLEQAFETDSPHGHFYCALMDLFSLHLADESEIPRDWIKRKTALSLLE